MTPRIQILETKKLIGQQLSMSLVNNKTGQLWGQFAPRIKEIQNRATTDKISMQVYPLRYYEQFNPNNEFVKWAAVEVTNFEPIPEGMQSLCCPRGFMPYLSTKVQVPIPPSFNTSFQNGCLNQNILLITDRILRFWAANTKTMTPIQKKRFGYLLRKNRAKSN